MNRPQMSKSAAALLRALLSRAGQEQNRILLTDWTSVDWQSLTFSGERHVAGFALRGPDALELAQRWTRDLEDAELPIGRSTFVADVAVRSETPPRDDGTVLLTIEALTLAA